MPQPELQAWRKFYVLYPFDDFNRFHRPAALIAARMGGGLESALRWLQPDPLLSGYSDSDASVLQTFGIKPPRKD